MEASESPVKSTELWCSFLSMYQSRYKLYQALRQWHNYLLNEPKITWKRHRGCLTFLSFFCLTCPSFFHNTNKLGLSIFFINLNFLDRYQKRKLPFKNNEIAICTHATNVSMVSCKDSSLQIDNPLMTTLSQSKTFYCKRSMTKASRACLWEYLWPR